MRVTDIHTVRHQNSFDICAPNPKRSWLFGALLALCLAAGGTLSADSLPVHEVIAGEAGSFIGDRLAFWMFEPEDPDPLGVLRAAGVDPEQAAGLRRSRLRMSAWHGILLDNTAGEAREVMLEFPYATLADIEMYVFVDGEVQAAQQQRAGIRLPFFERPVNRRYPLFPVQLAPGKTTFVLLMNNVGGGYMVNQMRYNTYLWDAHKYYLDAHGSDLVYWFFFGALLACMLFSGGLLYSSRDWVYLYYLGFCFFYLLMQYSAGGFGFQFSWPDLPQLNAIVPLTSFVGVGVCLANFTMAWLGTGSTRPRLARIIHLVSLATVCVALPVFFMVDHRLPQIAVPLVFLVVLTVLFFIVISLVIGLLEWRAGNARAPAFCLAWGVFLAAQSIGLLERLEILPPGPEQNFLGMIGALASILLISLSMYRRMSDLETQSRVARALVSVNEELRREVNERVEAEKRAEHLANHDALTGLPSLRLAREQLSYCMHLAGRRQWQVAVMFIDLDGFKAVNDRLGHSAGDDLLVLVADRLRASVRSTDTVARIGGDEFLVIQSETGNIEVLKTVAGKLVDAISAPYHLEGQEIRIGASVGIAMGSGADEDINDLLKRADAAMYQSKRGGKGMYSFAESDARAT